MMRKAKPAGMVRRTGRVESPADATRIFTTGWLLLALAACGSKGGGGGGASPGASAQGPDLAIASLSFSPSQANVGQQIHVIDIVRNDGDAASAASAVEIYLSADAFVTNADVLIGQRSIGALAPGAISSGGGFLTIPPAVTQGSWYLGVIVDGSGFVAEANEINNVQVALQTLVVSAAPASDLVPTQVEFDPLTVESGQVISVTDRVENHGVGAATSFQVGIYLSQDPNITSSDKLLGLRTVPSLAPGEISFISAPLTVPASTPSGLWFVGSLADVGGTQNESDEFNNGLVASAQITITQPPRPDLKMTSLTFSPAQLDAGQSLLISEFVVNQGLVPSTPFRVGIYLSTDGDITTADHLIGFRSLAGLNIGESSAVSAPVVVPTTIGGGTFHVGAIADHEQVVIESDEDNNTMVALGTVNVLVPPLPDLATKAVSFSPGAVAAGEAVTIVERVKNQGTVPAGVFRVGTYLSSNPSVSTSDVLLGTRTVTSLAVGETSEAMAQYTLPPGIHSGSWTVGVIADDLGGVLEPNEGNNLFTAAGHLDITASDDPLPNLTIISLSAGPSSLLQGAALTVASLVRNEGELTASQFQVRFYLSTDDVIESTDHLIGVRTVFNLGVGAGSAQSFPYTLDANLPLGVYRFGALCDDPDVILESDEDDNVFLVSGTFEIYVPPPPAPDLTLTALTFDPASVAVGASFQVTNTVKNVGDLAAGSYHVAYYLSEDAEVTDQDTLLGNGLTLPGLASAAESEALTELDIPVGTVAGTWYVGAIVVIESGDADSNSLNDILVASSTLEVIP